MSVIKWLTVTLVVVGMRMVDMHVARRNDRRDRVFVYHLADIVFQQYHELVERLDLALQLDSVNQED
jgi:hypothetical protein